MTEIKHDHGLDNKSSVRSSSVHLLFILFMGIMHKKRIGESFYTIPNNF